MSGWYISPHVGGKKIPIVIQDQIRHRIMLKCGSFAKYSDVRFEVRFSGHFCYVDAHEVGYDSSTHLVRLRFFAEEKWSLAFFTYSNEKYTPCVFPDGSWFGNPESAVEVAMSGL